MAKKRKSSKRRQRPSLGYTPDELNIAIRHVDAEIDAGDCKGAYEASLAAAGLVGAAVEAKQPDAGNGATQVRNVSRKFVDRCLVKRWWK